MIYLSGGNITTKVRHPRLGFLLTPDMGNRLPDGCCILAADNGCFTNPKDYSDDRYFAFLDPMPRERTIFATAPDVLGSHDKTVERSIPVLRQIRQMNHKSAFVAQDGWDEQSTPWDEFDAIFIGGTTEFKFRGGRHAVAAAKRRGKWAHMGRVNSLTRLRSAIGIGCDSADGTKVRFGPDLNWPIVLSWLDKITAQPEMAV